MSDRLSPCRGTSRNEATGHGGLTAAPTDGRPWRIKPFDWFAVDGPCPVDKHKTRIRVRGQCRQITGCRRAVSERPAGETGVSGCNGWLSGLSG